ncbi:MAG: hypothetical protein AB7F59_12800 [Bdellovibrionales bacterium]
MKKQNVILVALLALTLFNSACSEPKKSKASATVRGGARADGVPVDPGTGQVGGFGTDRKWGAITRGNNTQSQFDVAVKKFGSASVAEGDIGLTCGDTSCPDGTGVRFVGDVRLANNASVNSISGQVAPDSANSKIRVGIWDTLAVSGQVPGEVVVYFPGRVTGQVTQAGANLIFADDYGTLTLNGTFVGQTYQGTVSFQNSCSVNTAGECVGPGSSGTLGIFNVDKCGFFHCQ